MDTSLVACFYGSLCIFGWNMLFFLCVLVSGHLMLKILILQNML